MRTNLNEVLPSVGTRPNFTLYLFVPNNTDFSPGFTQVDLYLTSDGSFDNTAKLIQIPLRRSNIFSSALSTQAVWPYPAPANSDGRIFKLEGIWPEQVFNNTIALTAGNFRVRAVTSPSRRVSNNELTLMPPIGGTSISGAPFQVFPINATATNDIGEGVQITIDNTNTGGNRRLMLNVFSGVTSSTYFELQASVSGLDNDWEVIATDFIDGVLQYPLTSFPANGLKFNGYLTHDFIRRAIDFANNSTSPHPVGRTCNIHFRVVSKLPTFIVSTVVQVAGPAYPFTRDLWVGSGCPALPCSLPLYPGPYYQGRYLTLNPINLANFNEVVPTNTEQYNNHKYTGDAATRFPLFGNPLDEIDVSDPDVKGLYCMGNSSIPFAGNYAVDWQTNEEIYIEMSNSDLTYSIDPIVIGRIVNPRVTPNENYASNIWLGSLTYGSSWRSIISSNNVGYNVMTPMAVSENDALHNVWYVKEGTSTAPLGAYVVLDFERAKNGANGIGVGEHRRIRAVTANSHMISDEIRIKRSALGPGYVGATNSENFSPARKKLDTAVLSIKPVNGKYRTFQLLENSPTAIPEILSSVFVFDLMGKQILSLDNVKVSDPITIPGDIKGKLLVRVTNETGSETHSIFVNQ